MVVKLPQLLRRFTTLLKIPIFHVPQKNFIRESRLGNNLPQGHGSAPSGDRIGIGQETLKNRRRVAGRRSEIAKRYGRMGGQIAVRAAAERNQFWYRRICMTAEAG